MRWKKTQYGFFIYGEFYKVPVEMRERMERSNGREYTKVLEYRLPKELGRYPTRPVIIQREYWRVGEKEPYAYEDYDFPVWFGREVAYRVRKRQDAEFYSTPLNEALAAAVSK